MPFPRPPLRHHSLCFVAAFVCGACTLCPVAWAQEAGPDSMGMPGMYGGYDMTREASGTSWQPDSTPMSGIHSMTGAWMSMLHGYADVVYDHQGGPRGNEQTFTTGMLMFMARRDLTDGAFGLRLMVSGDPPMGKSGYPLLFQTGETANGRTPLIDRQHPHNLLMEAAGGAPDAPLARLESRVIRRRDGWLHLARVQARSVRVQRPRAGSVPLRHRTPAAAVLCGAALLQPDA
jgi:hypothetical protein